MPKVILIAAVTVFSVLACCTAEFAVADLHAPPAAGRLVQLITSSVESL